MARLLLRGQALPVFCVPMVSLASWNIRGLNRVPKQQEVQQVVRDNQLSVCAVLESHVHFSKLQQICSKVFIHWNWNSNARKCVGGSRIIFGWDPQLVDLMLISDTDQVLHCQISTRTTHKSFFCSIVYAGNYYIHRRELWTDLNKHKLFVG